MATDEDRMRDALKAAIAKFPTAKDFAEEIGVTPQAVSQWEVVPPGRVLLVERLTGISRHDLRPDYYPAPEPAAEPAVAA